MGKTFELSVDQIAQSRWQPRQRSFDPMTVPEDGELVESIRRHGVLTRLLVWKNPEGQWELIAGHRRLAAAKMAALSTVPVEDVGTEHPDRELQAMVLVENLARSDLTAIEEARAYWSLKELRGMTQERLAELVGCSQARISQRLGLLRLDAAVQEQVERNELSPSVARTLVTVDDRPLQKALASHVVAEVSVGKMTTQEAENMVRTVELWSHPEFWSVAEGREVPQDRRVCGRVLTGLWQELDSAGRLPEVLPELYARAGQLGWKYTRYEPGAGVESWEADVVLRFVQNDSCQGWMKKHGMTCATCTSAARGVPPKEWGPCQKKGTETCMEWLADDDPIRIPLYGVSVEMEGCASCSKRVAIGERDNYCSDAICYSARLQEKQNARSSADKTKVQRAQQRAMAMSADWLDAQGAMDTRHWLARSCYTCAYLGHGEHCQKAEQHREEHYAPFHLAVAQREGVTVPLCSSWRPRSLDLVADGRLDVGTVLVFLSSLGKDLYRLSNWFELVGMGASTAGNPTKAYEWLSRNVFNPEQAAGLLVLLVNQTSCPGLSGLGGYGDSRKWVVHNPVAGGVEEWTVEVAPDGVGEWKEREAVAEEVGAAI